jgi:hypothetical protein
MKRNLLVLFALGFGLLVAAGPVVAHHGFMGIFDLRTPVTFEGVITRVEWENPHISFNVDVKDANGKVTSWRFEGANPGALKTRGWARTDLRIGDKITLRGYRATNGLSVAAVGVVTLPDGRTLDAASDGVPPHPAKKVK